MCKVARVRSQADGNLSLRPPSPYTPACALPVPLLSLARSLGMGLTISSLFTSLSSLVRWSKDQDVRILMLGLDAAGKVCQTCRECSSSHG